MLMFRASQKFGFLLRQAIGDYNYMYLCILYLSIPLIINVNPSRFIILLTTATSNISKNILFQLNIVSYILLQITYSYLLREKWLL